MSSAPSPKGSCLFKSFRTKGFGLNAKILISITVLAAVLFLVLASVNQHTLDEYFTHERELQYSQLNHNLYRDIQLVVDEMQSLTYAMLLDSQDRMQSLDLTREKLKNLWGQMRVNAIAQPSYMVLMQEQGEFVDSWGYQLYDDDTLNFLRQPRTSTEFRLRCETACELIIAAPFRFDVGLAVIHQLTVGYSVPVSTLLSSLSSNDGSEFFLFTGEQRQSAKLTTATGRFEHLDSLFKSMTCDPRIENCPVIINHREHIVRAHQLKSVRVMDAQPVFAASVMDVSNMKEAMRQARFEYLVYSLLGILALQILLYSLMRIPLKRIRRLSRSLPLLAKSKYQEYRRRVGVLENTNKLRVPDETDQLIKTSKALSAQLEQMQDELLQHNAHLAWLADHDQLTEMQNRECFLREANMLLKQSRQATVFFIDLDNFKFVNDFSGHKCGDELLVSVVNSMQRVMSQQGLCARMGGDEFAFLLPDVDENVATVVANRLLRSISRVMVSGPNKVHQASASLGVAHYPRHSTDLTELLAAADTAMYQAKQQGKNRVCVFQRDAIGRDLKERGYWLGHVAQATTGDRLKLAFQPIQSNRDGTISHYEVLLRFVDEDDNICSAYPLILAAEESGQIGQIDEWVVNQVIAQLQAVPRERLGVSLAVNLSGRTFGDERTLKRLYRVMEDAGELCQHLILEVTETAALQNIQQARDVISQLKAYGCRIAMDDFGVGFSSFHSLKELPVDYVKIDGSFVRELQHNQDDQVFVQALVDIASHFRYKTVAEFVENAELNQLLLELGVDYSQGYYIGKPQLTVPAVLVADEPNTAANA